VSVAVVVAGRSQNGSTDHGFATSIGFHYGVLTLGCDRTEVGLQSNFRKKKERFPQESSSSVAYFSVSENVVLDHHIHHAKHHKFTTKNHSLHTTFSNNPQKMPVKQQNPGAIRLAPGSNFFL